MGWLYNGHVEALQKKTMKLGCLPDSEILATNPISWRSGVSPSSKAAAE
jgi:hypothetical protein